jgi:hypothetical protein
LGRRQRVVDERVHLLIFGVDEVGGVESLTSAAIRAVEMADRIA